MCVGPQAQTNKEEEFLELQKEQRRIERSDWKKISEVCEKQEKEEDRKRAPAISRNTDFWQLKQKECL